MKTKELVKKIQELDRGLGISISKDNYIALKTWNGNEIVIVKNEDVWLNKTWFELGSPLEKAIKLMFDYAHTPLEEREEEKYRLRLSDNFSVRDFMGLYLNFEIESNEYSFNSSENGVNGFKTIFTKKEIDAMPFDTNFFIKEEV